MTTLRDIAAAGHNALTDAKDHLAQLRRIESDAESELLKAQMNVAEAEKLAMGASQLLATVQGKSVEKILEEYKIEIKSATKPRAQPQTIHD